MIKLISELTSRFIFLTLLMVVGVACEQENHFPGVPSVAVRSDSLFIELDQGASYSEVYVSLLLGEHNFQPLGISLRDFPKSMRHASSLRDWSYFDNVTAVYHYFWNAEKPEYVVIDGFTTQKETFQWVFIRQDQEYSLLRAIALDSKSERIESHWIACPDSLEDELDRALKSRWSEQ